MPFWKSHLPVAEEPDAPSVHWWGRLSQLAQRVLQRFPTRPLGSLFSNEAPESSRPRVNS